MSYWLFSRDVRREILQQAEAPSLCVGRARAERMLSADCAAAEVVIVEWPKGLLVEQVQRGGAS